MSEDMSISVNGQARVPPGFRFHPTEEELLQYYLKKKVSYEKIDLDVIRDVDLNKLEPWDIQEKCRIGTTPQNDWYFFCHKDKKYPTGTRTNRATTAGFWKATGRDKMIYGHGRRIGMRKTLVFYRGRAPNGQKSDWIMHEYRLDDDIDDHDPNATQEDGMVVCRIFKKRTHHKSVERNSSSSSSVTQERDKIKYMEQLLNEGSLEQMLEHIGRSSCKKGTDVIKGCGTAGTLAGTFDSNRFMKLPSMVTSSSAGGLSCYQPFYNESETTIPNNQLPVTNPDQVYPVDSNFMHWPALDRLVASHLNDQTETARQFGFFNHHFTSTVPCNPNVEHQAATGFLFPTLKSLPSNLHGTEQQMVMENEIDLWHLESTSPPIRSFSSFDPFHLKSNHTT